MKKMFGAFLIALPFICIYALFAYEAGLLVATLPFVLAFSIAGLVYAGVSLCMSNGKRQGK